MKDFLIYLVWPLPGNADYTSPKALALLIICLFLILVSFAIKSWRRKNQNTITKKLSRTWASAMFWFGLVGLFLVVCRVEDISYLSMRLWWLVWGLAFAIYLVFQIKQFKRRNYEKLPTEYVDDPRDKYLPKKKKR